MRSWQTTLAGVGAIMVALGGAIVAQFDMDPTTAPNWEVAIAAVVAGFGLLRARDNDKSSEDVGAK